MTCEERKVLAHTTVLKQRERALLNPPKQKIKPFLIKLVRDLPKEN